MIILCILTYAQAKYKIIDWYYHEIIIILMANN
jgi:hypothetical protein